MKQRLGIALDGAVRDLTTHDQVLHAAECAVRPDADIWCALSNGDASLAPVLKSQASQHGLGPFSETRKVIDLSRIAPLTLKVFDVLPSSNPFELQVLLQVSTICHQAFLFLPENYNISWMF